MFIIYTSTVSAQTDRGPDRSPKTHVESFCLKNMGLKNMAKKQTLGPFLRLDRATWAFVTCDIG